MLWKSEMKKHITVFVSALLILLIFVAPGFAYPLEFTESSGKTIRIEKRPERVVSIVPSVTEAIFRIGAGDQVVGVTWHNVFPPEVAEKQIVGGFFAPSIKKIKALKPDLIFVSGIQKEVSAAFDGKTGTSPVLIRLETKSIDDSFAHLMLLGEIFGKEAEAEEVIRKNRKELDIIKRKTDQIGQKKRVLRLMGRDTVMVPGDDSFQNEVIRLAGGIPPKTGRNGTIITMTLDEWKDFNPQIIYGCGGDKNVLETLLSKPGWRDVDAVKNRRYLDFSCDLTCRASTNTGYFAGWLAAGIYPEEFGKKEKQVVDESVFLSTPMNLDLAYVESAKIKRSWIHDFINKTFVVELKKPMAVVSTLEGYRENIRRVGNHYFPAQTWGLGHSEGLKGLRKRTYGVLELDEADTSCLFTGADMDNLSIKTQTFRDMKVTACVTAGVRGNALKMSKDNGGYYEPGTINIIIMSNMRLSRRAMTRAIISATEAKSAVMADLDIRSTYTSRKHQATGTGTDNILVVEGEGQLIENAGGHSKMGELIAKAVYEGVKEAIYNQNGIIPGRNIFQRLKERKISVSGIGNISGCDCNIEKSEFKAEVEKVLLDPYFSGFLESAFVVSDAYEQGTLSNLDAFRRQSQAIAEEIAGGDVEMRELIDEEMPVVMKTALNAILNGVVGRLAQ